MFLILKRTIYFLVRGILTLSAIFFIAVITVQLALVVGINLVSTGKGSSFIAAKANEALVDSGYKISFDSLYYDPVRGFTVYGLSVSDTQSTFLTLDRFSLSISLALSPARTLQLYANGGTLRLDRLPSSAEESPEETQNLLTPFPVPDIYFKTILLSNLSFERVVVGESIAGKTYELSPSLRARATLNEDIHLALTLRPGLAEAIPGLPSPEKINFSGTFVPETLALSIDDLSAHALSYILSIKGSGTLSDDGSVNLKAQAQHRDLALLTGEIFQEASAKIFVTGPITGPALDLSAAFVTLSLKERGLSDINISLKTEDISNGMKGQINIQTAFQDEPVLLESALSYEAPHLHLKDIKGSAPDLTLTGNGTFSTQTSLFDGMLSLSAENLAHYSELAGLTLAGKLNTVVTLKPSDEMQQSADISASLTNGMLDGIKVKILSAQAAFASLSVPWPQSAKLESSILQVAKNVTFDKISAAISQTGEQNYKMSLNGSGHVPTELSFNGTAMLSDLTQTIPTARDIVLNVKQGASSASLTGNFTTDELDLALTSNGFRGRDLPLSLPDQLKNLSIDLDAGMKGTPAEPQSYLAATLNGIGAGAYQNASVSIKAEHNGKTAKASLTGQGTGIRALSTTASFPMGLSLLPFNFTMDRSAPVTGKISADINLATIAPLFIPPTQTLSGNLAGNGVIGGTIGNPLPNVTLGLNDVSFDDQQNGIILADLKASATMKRDSLTLTSLSATDGKDGTLSGEGTVYFSGDAANVSLRLQNFNAPQSNLANGIINAVLSLKGSDEGFHLWGKADIAEMNVLVPETFSSKIPQLNIIEDEKDTGNNLLKSLMLDIAIDAKNQVFVRGWGLDAEFGGNLSITGAADNPQFNGTLSSLRGRYEEFGKRFTLARGDLRFQGNVPPSPYLDIEATIPAGDVTGSILLTGPIQSPSIAFSSVPSLPQDEVLSRILFGKEASRISPFQAVQLAQTVRRFSGQGGGSDLDPLGLVRSATGLDDISVETDESGATHVGAGKYLSDNVYLEVNKGKAANSGEATIQIEVTPSIKIESQIGQDAQGGAGVFWTRDY